MAERLEWSMDAVREAKEAVLDAISLDKSLSSEDSAPSLGDLLEDERTSDTPGLVIKKAEGAWLGEVIRGLPPRHRQVLVRRYGLDHREPATLAKLSGELKMSRERIRQLQRQAELILKHR